MSKAVASPIGTVNACSMPLVPLPLDPNVPNSRITPNSTQTYVHIDLCGFFGFLNGHPSSLLFHQLKPMTLCTCLSYSEVTHEALTQ